MQLWSTAGRGIPGRECCLQSRHRRLVEDRASPIYLGLHNQLHTYHFLQAAQLDGQVRFLKEAEGATDGWAQAVISPGWSIQHSFGYPWDFQVGKQYRMFIRAKATATERADGTAISVGIHVSDGSRTCAKSIKRDEVDGTWQVFDIGVWNPTEAGGIFYIARGRSGVEDVLLDSVWLVETTEEKN